MWGGRTLNTGTSEAARGLRSSHAAASQRIGRVRALRGGKKDRWESWVVVRWKDEDESSVLFVFCQ